MLSCYSAINAGDILAHAASSWLAFFKFFQATFKMNKKKTGDANTKESREIFKRTQRGGGATNGQNQDFQNLISEVASS